MSFRNESSLLEKLIGVLLALVGFAFLALLIFLDSRGELIGYLKVWIFLFCIGAGLIWIGCLYFFSRPEPLGPIPREDPDRCLPYLLRLRPIVEFLAVVGVVVAAVQAAGLLYVAGLVPTREGQILASAPVLIGMFALRVLIPGAFQTGVFPDEVLRRWSGTTKTLVRLLVQVGWLGYPAILAAWLGFRNLAWWPERPAVQFASSILICLLYASQVVVLHFGKTRQVRNGT